MIDPRERYSDPEQMLRLALQSWQSGLWTAIPGIIEEFDATTCSATVQPAIKGVIQGRDGFYSAAEMPLLLDVPVLFPRGGNCMLTFPIAKGDEVLVVFSSRCIDAWWVNGGTQIPLSPRKHDLSDGVAIPGPFSLPAIGQVASLSSNTVQLRSNDGSTYVELDPAGKVVHVKAPGGMTIDANVTINGDVTSTGTVTGKTDVKGGDKDISLKSHLHSGVASGGSNSGPPVG
jgi:hypothetical protein